MIESRNRAGWMRGLVLTAGVALVAVACTTPAASSASAPASEGSPAGSAAPSTGSTGPIGVTLITKTASNPFFVAMANGAKESADELGITLTTAAGKEDGDTATQVQAVETDRKSVV